MTATRGGLTYVDQTAPAPASLAEMETPDDSRKSFEEHVKTAAGVVNTQQ